MKLPHFVSGSAMVIVGWLVITFIHQVSPLQYPSQRQNVSSRTASLPSPTLLPGPQTAMPDNPANLAATNDR